MERVRQLAMLNIGVGLAVLALKLVAWWWTGSIALYSDALESIVNVAAAIGAYLAVSWSALPADPEHPYGHHKAEYLAAVVEGSLIIVAAFAVLKAAWAGFAAPQPVVPSVAGIAVSMLASAINGAWAWTLVAEGRRSKSPALVADGHHLFADVASSAGVLIGILLAIATGWHILDPALAALVGVHILWAGSRLVKESVGGLMDEATPPLVQRKIREIIASEAGGALEAHDLRTRQAARATFVDFHLVVAGTMTVTEAHEICDRIEAALKRDVPGAIITIHVEPEHKAKHKGVVVL